MRLREHLRLNPFPATDPANAPPVPNSNWASSRRIITFRPQRPHQHPRHRNLKSMSRNDHFAIHETKMKTWKLILFLAAILIIPASRGATLTFNQIQQDCETYLDSTGVGHETYSTNIGSMQSSFQQSDANVNISSSINSVITLSGNMLSISGNGQCSYAENSQYGFTTFSYVSVLFSISSTFYYSIQAQVIDPGPNYNGSAVYVSNYKTSPP